MTGWQLPHLVLAFDWYLLTLMEKVIFLFKKVSQKLRLSPQYLEKINQRLFYNIEKSWTFFHSERIEKLLDMKAFISLALFLY